jgi:hypothetical protein
MQYEWETKRECIMQRGQQALDRTGSPEEEAQFPGDVSIHESHYVC